MKNIFLGIFLLSCLAASAQGFSIELEGGTLLGINKFVYTNGVSPYFWQRSVLGSSVGLFLSKLSKKETANAYFSVYIATYSRKITAILKKGEAVSLLENGDGSDFNLGLRWNYCGRNRLHYDRGIMLGFNAAYGLNRFINFPKGIGSSVNGVTKRAIYLDNVVKFYGVVPSLQIGLFKGIKLRKRSYLRFSLYGNIGFKVNSYWYYRAVIENVEYAAVIKNKGDFVNLSVCYGYWSKKSKSGDANLKKADR